MNNDESYDLIIIHKAMNEYGECKPIRVVVTCRENVIYNDDEEPETYFTLVKAILEENNKELPVSMITESEVYEALVSEENILPWENEEEEEITEIL